MEGDQIWLRAEILTNDGRQAEGCDVRFRAGDDEAPADLAYRLLDAAAPPLRSLFAG